MILPMRRIRICYVNTWAGGLEPAADYVARVPELDLQQPIANPRDAGLLRKALGDLAGKVFGMLAVRQIRRLYYSFDEASTG